jgi:hypothetical protein
MVVRAAAARPVPDDHEMVPGKELSRQHGLFELP